MSTANDSRPVVWMPLVLAAAGTVVYANSFDGVFLFDDTRQLVDNWRVGRLEQMLLSRRPVTDGTFLLNHHLNGLDVRGYHAVNVLVHLLAGLVLFGLVRRTLGLERLRPHFGERARWLAFAAALLWIVHPLQTESVTYVIQRAEALASLFYLLTLYAVLRGASADRRGWYVIAVVACALGMGSKAIVITAPVLTCLYDRVFLSRSFGEVLRRRWGLYAALAATWSILHFVGVAPEVIAGSSRTLTVGFGFRGVTPLDYALTQPQIILHYLRLAVWPHRLCLDYWWQPVGTLAEAVGPGLILTALLAGTVWLLWKRPALGFLAASFFIVLSPTSSFVPIKDLAFEHRMYLPLAAVMVGLALGADAVLARLAGPRAARRIGAGLLVVVACTWGALTVARNRVYADAETMWRDVLKSSPENPRAHTSLATAVRGEDPDAAIALYLEALRLKPDLPVAHANLANLYGRRGETARAIEHYETALRLNHKRHVVHLNLGNMLVREGHVEEAVQQFRAGIDAFHAFAPNHHALGNALLSLGAVSESVTALRETVRLEPESAEARGDLGRALVQAGAANEAIEQLQAAVRLDPDNAAVRNNLAGAFMAAQRGEEAIEQVVEAIRIEPENAEAIRNLAIALAKRGDVDATIARYASRASLTRAHALAYLFTGDRALNERRIDEAATAYRRALAIDADLGEARERLELIRSMRE